MLCGLIVVELAHWPATARKIAAPVAASPSPGPPTLPTAPVLASADPTTHSNGDTASRKTWLKVQVTPDFARIGIDGSLLPARTREIVMATDQAAHRVWAEAPGYQTRAEWIRLDGREMSLQLTLSRNERPHITATARSIASAQAPRAGARQESPATASAARVRLDTTDPWKD
jgi:hypothetical protein